jgi:hydroxyacylglutathione hydrolase
VPILDELPGLHPIAAREITDKQLRDCQLVDVRSPEAFGGAHITGALNLPMNASFSNWAGWQLNYQQPILVVLDDPSQMETVSRRLVRIGLDKILGYIEGGISGWCRAGREVTPLAQITASMLRQKMAKEKLQVLDVREPHEFSDSHIKGAINIRGGLLAKELKSLKPNQPVAVYCGSGNRSSVGASILQKHGFKKVYNVVGGLRSWQAAKVPVEKTKTFNAPNSEMKAVPVEYRGPVAEIISAAICGVAALS